MQRPDSHPDSHSHVYTPSPEQGILLVLRSRSGIHTDSCRRNYVGVVVVAVVAVVVVVLVVVIKAILFDSRSLGLP